MRLAGYCCWELSCLSRFLRNLLISFRTKKKQLIPAIIVKRTVDIKLTQWFAVTTHSSFDFVSPNVEVRAVVSVHVVGCIIIWHSVYVSF